MEKGHIQKRNTHREETYKNIWNRNTYGKKTYREMGYAQRRDIHGGRIDGEETHEMGIYKEKRHSRRGNI